VDRRGVDPIWLKIAPLKSIVNVRSLATKVGADCPIRDCLQANPLESKRDGAEKRAVPEAADPVITEGPRVVRSSVATMFRCWISSGVDDLFSYPSPNEIKGELVDSSLIEVLNSIVI
jgi:hypothetical protein